MTTVILDGSVRSHRGMSPLVRFWLPWALVALLTLLLAAEVVVIAPTPSVLVLIAAALWMALPGVALARRVFGDREPTLLAAWCMGPALGLGISVFGLLVLWAAGLQNWLAIVVAPALTWACVALAARFGVPTLRLPGFFRHDIVAISIALLVVPLVTWLPYDHIREPVEDGEAYRAYFTADFVWAMTVTAEVAKGDVPPVNPYLHDATLHYYWMSHLLSGAVYRNIRRWGVTAEQVVLTNGLVFGLAFVGFFYALARFAGASPAFAALAVAAAFLANSYEGFNRIWIMVRDGWCCDAIRRINIDAVTRWFYEGMPVDGLQRMLLYQPHHFTGYALSLAALWLSASAEDITETSVALWAGILLGLGFLFSTFTAIIVGVAVGLVFAVRLLARRAVVPLIQAAVLGGGPLAVAIVLTGVLGYTDPHAGMLLMVGVNPVALRQWPFMLLLNFGPLLFAGIAGLLRVKRVTREGAAPAALVVSAFAFYFLVDVPDMDGVWVGWRSGHLLLIAFAVMGAAALTHAWARPAVRVPLVIALLVLLAPAVPTVAIDVYNAQDITNRASGNFPWTLIITPQEREALDWIRHATPVDAVVQFEPEARGNGHWGYITAFGERRMAAGLPHSMIPFAPYLQATDDVRTGIFKASSADEAHAVAAFLGIDYLFVGKTERREYRAAIVQIAARPDLFPPAFRNDLITIYGVTK